MSERIENTEFRIREALLAEASEAPAPPNLWARVEPRLERFVTPIAGWQQRWRLVAAGTAAAVVLTIGGAGAALIATGQFPGGEDGGSSAEKLWIGTSDGSLDAFNGDESTAILSNPDSTRFGRGETDSFADSVDPGLPGESTQGPEPRLTLVQPEMTVATGQSGSWNPQASTSERQIISQASLDLEVSDVNTAATQLRGLVQSFGGFIEHISTSGGLNPEYGSAVVRVPSDRLLDALEGIERLGKAVGQTLGQHDVTGEAIDLEARLRSERSTEESLLKLLDRAESVGDVLTVERELNRGRAGIERLQGQLDFIQRSVTLATITVSFILPPGTVPVAPSASLQLEVEEVEPSVRLVQELVERAGGSVNRVIVTTRENSQEAFLSFSVPASALDGVLNAMVREGVVLHREVESYGSLRQDGRDDDLQASVTVQLQTNNDPPLWRSPGVLLAGGLLILLAVVVTLALLFRARRRRG